MDAGPLTKLAAVRPHRPWLVQNALAVTSLALGVVGFVVVVVTQQALWTIPDWRISVPAFVVTASVAGGSIARRERAYPIWLLGVGLAGASIVLGWFFLLAIVVVVTTALILILHALM